MKNLAILLALSLLAACHDDDGDPVDSTPSGNSLVRDMIEDNTTDSAEPVEINDLDLQFSEDENAYSDLLD